MVVWRSKPLLRQTVQSPLMAPPLEAISLRLPGYYGSVGTRSATKWRSTIC